MIRMLRAHILCYVRAWAPGIPSGFPGFASSAWACPFDPSSFVLPAAWLPKRRDPDSRVSCASLCRRGRAYRGGAARAPDCARETQGAPLLCVSQGFFRAGANGETKRPRGGRFLPPAIHNNTDSVRSIRFPRIISRKTGIGIRRSLPECQPRRQRPGMQARSCLYGAPPGQQWPGRGRRSGRHARPVTGRAVRSGGTAPAVLRGL